MSFAADLAAELKPAAKPCLVGQWVSRLDNSDQEAFNDGLADLSIDSEMLMRVMKKHGYTGSVHVVRKHRNEGCTCVASR